MAMFFDVEFRVSLRITAFRQSNSALYPGKQEPHNFSECAEDPPVFRALIMLCVTMDHIVWERFAICNG